MRRIERYSRGECVCEMRPKYAAPLEPEFSHECSIVGNENGVLDISCQYRFAGNAAQTKIVEIEIKYSLTYAISSPEPLSGSDLIQFANGNGTLHSWPFVREFLYSMTSRMGLPAFKLGVMHFVPTSTSACPRARTGSDTANLRPAHGKAREPFGSWRAKGCKKRILVFTTTGWRVAQPMIFSTINTG